MFSRRIGSYDAREVDDLQHSFQKFEGGRAAALASKPERLVELVRCWLVTRAQRLLAEDDVGVLATHALFRVARSGEGPAAAIVLLGLGTRHVGFLQPLAHVALDGSLKTGSVDMLVALCTLGGVDPNAVEVTRVLEWSALCASVEQANYAATRALVEDCGAKVDLVLESESRDVPCCALGVAALLGDAKHVRYFLAAGADPRLVHPRHGVEPLYLALAAKPTARNEVSRDDVSVHARAANFRDVVMALVEARGSNRADFAPDDVITALFHESPGGDQTRLHPYVRALFDYKPPPAAAKAAAAPPVRERSRSIPTICDRCYLRNCECDTSSPAIDMTAPASSMAAVPRPPATRDQAPPPAAPAQRHTASVERLRDILGRRDVSSPNGDFLGIFDQGDENGRPIIEGSKNPHNRVTYDYSLPTWATGCLPTSCI